MSKSYRKAEKKLEECFSWKGEAFEPHGHSRSSVGRYAKRFTNRTRRRLDHSVEKFASEDEG